MRRNFGVFLWDTDETDSRCDNADENPHPDPVFERNEAIQRRGRRDTKVWWGLLVEFRDCCILKA